MYKILEIIFVVIFIIINFMVAIRGYFRGRTLEDEQPTTVLHVPTLVRSHNYLAEKHSVQTEDGYILELHRIPKGRLSSSREVDETGEKPIAFMVHCILCTSSIWVMQGPEKGLGYLLADAGYDVWMMNVRGNSYSQSHVDHSPGQKIFWEFSFHEMGFYDVPASIDYILKATNQTAVNYIGYSMGTTIYFAMAGSRPEYNKKILKAVALAPAVFVQHAEGFVPDLSFHRESLESSFEKSEAWKIPPTHWGLRSILSNICSYSITILEPICSSVLNFLAKVYVTGLDLEMLSYYFTFFPDYTSLKNALHYFQVKNTDIFSQYDYGATRNLVIYGSRTPPLYNLDQINNSIHLIYSTGDKISAETDVLHLHSILRNAHLYKIDIPSFSHAHFCWGSDVRELVYEKVLEILSK